MPSAEPSALFGKLELVVEKLDPANARHPRAYALGDRLRRDFSPKDDMAGRHLDIDVDLPHDLVQVEGGSYFREKRDVVDSLAEALGLFVSAGLGEGGIDREAVVDTFDAGGAFR